MTYDAHGAESVEDQFGRRAALPMLMACWNGQTIRLLVVGDPDFKSMQKMHDELEKLGGQP